MMLYIVKYVGPFGFIKPWTAVRDSQTFSQQFLTPSVIEGMEKKLFPRLLPRKGLQGYIVGHRLHYQGVSVQQETTWSKEWVETRGAPVIQQRPMKNGTIKNVMVSTFTRRPATSIITRGVLIEPTLYLAFPRKMMAHIASSQHLCLCRNEDLLLPADAYKVTIGEWHSDLFPGFEFTFGKDSAPLVNVGLNRYADSQPMFGELHSFGNPIQDHVMVDSVYEQQNKLYDTKEALIPFTRNHITSLVTAACNAYQTSQLGGIHNLKITVTNNTSFLLDNVKVKVTYFKATGAVWSIQTIDFSSVRSNSTSSITLPDTTGGTTVKYRIISIKASSLGITELELE